MDSAAESRRVWRQQHADIAMISRVAGEKVVHFEGRGSDEDEDD